MVKILCLFSLLVVITANAQDSGSIAGKVLDLEMKNEPMVFANVQLKGEYTTTQSNLHGNFKLENLATGEYTLMISYAGYKELEFIVKVEKNKTSKVLCELSAKTLVLSNLINTQ